MSILKLPYIQNYLFIIVILSCFKTTFAQLPDFSSQSNPQEKHEGILFSRSIWESGAVNSDIESVVYLKKLGKKLVKTINSHKDFKFILLNIGQINAFAGPDANIGIFSGLIEASDNEAELASVLAHEIAHVTQNHLNRHQQKTKNSTVLVLASILAAIVVPDRQVSTAIVLSTQAGVAQRSVDWTREHETEADSIGIKILHKSGFSAKGMAGFFKKLLKFDTHQSLEFLRTHPLSINRVAQATKLAKQYQGGRINSFTYKVVKAKLQYAKNKNNQKINFNATPLVKLYMEVLNTFNNKDYSRAEKLAQTLIKKNQNPTIKTLVARIKAKNHKLTEALKLFNRLDKTSEIRAYYLAQAYFDNNKIDKATQILKRFLKTYEGSYYSYKKLASFYLKQNNLVKFHMTMSEALVKKYAFLEAKQQLNRAKVNTYDDYYLNRIKAKEQQINKLIEKFDS